MPRKPYVTYMESIGEAGDCVMAPAGPHLAKQILRDHEIMVGVRIASSLPPLSEEQPQEPMTTYEYKLAFYRDAAGEHRWRLTHSNGQIVGASSEGFSSEDEAEANADRVADAMHRMRGSSED